MPEEAPVTSAVPLALLVMINLSCWTRPRQVTCMMIVTVTIIMQASSSENFSDRAARRGDLIDSRMTGAT